MQTPSADSHLIPKSSAFVSHLQLPEERPCLPLRPILASRCLHSRSEALRFPSSTNESPPEFDVGACRKVKEELTVDSGLGKRAVSEMPRPTINAATVDLLLPPSLTHLV